jgi:hypothetical protein
VDQDGRPSAALIEIHRLLTLLNQSREMFADALDHYLIAELLTPLSGHASGDQLLYVIDRNRFDRMDHAAHPGPRAKCRARPIDAPTQRER